LLHYPLLDIDLTVHLYIIYPM